MSDARLRDVLAFLTFFGFVVSAIYLFGYWGEFHLNPLEYVDFSDIAKLALYPLAGTLFMYLVGYVLGKVLLGDDLHEGGGNETRIGKYGLTHPRILLSSVITATFLLIIFVDAPYKWLGATLVFSNVSVFLTHADFLIELIPSPKVRSMALSLFFVVPGLAYFFGSLNAHLIINGQSYLYLDPDKPSPLIESSGNNAYVGYLGNYFVFYQVDTHKIELVSPPSGSALYFLQYSAK